MATNVVYNGATYIVPAVADASWGQNVTNYLIALATGSLQKAGGAFTLTSEVDFGSTFGLKAPYFKSKTANIAAAGVLRLANADVIGWKNAGNTADLPLTVDATNTLLFNGLPVAIAGSGTGIGAANTVLTTNSGATASAWALLAVANIAAASLTGTGSKLVTDTVPTLVTPIFSSYTDFTDISSPAAPAAGKTRVYSKNGNVYKQTATLPETLLGGGSGSGSKNYLSASTSTAAGWSSTGSATATTDTTVADLPEPSVGTGILFALGVAGNYSYARWTLDPADYNSPRIILKAAVKTLASYVGGNAKIEVYSNTAANYTGTSTRLGLSTDVSAVSALSTAQNYLGFYDNPGSSAPYMELRIVTVTATGTLCMSSISTGPGQAVQSANLGPETSWTPAIAGLGTPTSVTGKFSVQGEFIVGSVYGVTSSPNGVLLTLSLPNNWTTSAGLGQPLKVGDWQRGVSTATSVKNGIIIAPNAANSSVLNFSLNDYTTALGPYAAANGNTLFSSGEVFEFNFRVRIDQLVGAVTNLGQNAIQYAASTSGTWDAASTGANTVYGPAGAPISGALTAGRSKVVNFQSPISNPIVQYRAVGTNIWVNQGDSYWPWTDWPSVGFGAQLVISGTNQVTVSFAQFASPGTTYNSTTGALNYSAAAYDAWRVVDALPGQATGFGAYQAPSPAIPTGAAGLVPASGLPGRTDGNAPAAGNVGEVVTSLIPASGGVSLTTTTPKNLLSITLSPGNWLLYGNVSFTGTTTAASFLQAEFSLSANTQNQPPNGQSQGSDGSMIATPASSNLNSIGKFGGALAPIRVPLTATTTIFIVAYAIFASGTVQVSGRAEAVRLPG